MPDGEENSQGDDQESGQGEGGEWNGEPFDAERARRLVSELRNERKTLKAQLSEREKALREREEAEKSEIQKAQDRAAELEKRVAEYEAERKVNAVRGQIAEVAGRLGAHYPEDVYDLVAKRLEVSDDGKVKNAEAAVKELASARPILFRDGRSPNERLRSGASNEGDPASGDMNARIRRAAGRQ